MLESVAVRERGPDRTRAVASHSWRQRGPRTEARRRNRGGAESLSVDGGIREIGPTPPSPGEREDLTASAPWRRRPHPKPARS
jgi:hypothetical protein